LSDFHNFPSPHCHVQSLDTGSTPEAFADREVELGTGTLTATDHGTLAACRRVYDLAREKNLTPVLGVEGYFRDDDCPILERAGVPKTYYDPEKNPEKAAQYPTGTYREYIKYHHLTIHLQDQKAYEVLSKVLSRADLRAEQHGSERKPLFGWTDLEQIGQQNVTMTTGCLIGMVQRHLLDQDDGRTAIAYYERLRSLVKPGNFYVEVFPHDCSRNYEDAVFLTLMDGQRLRFYPDKLLRVDGEEVRAEQLAKRKPKEVGFHGHLEAIKHYRKWHDREPINIVKVERVEGFIENECRPWARTSDVQEAANRFVLALARKYGDPVLISDDAHYAKEDDKVVQDVRLAQSGSWRFWGKYHRQTSAQAFEYFRDRMGIPETQFRGWVDNNRAWVEKFKDFRFDTPPSLPTKFYPQDTLGYLLGLIRKRGRIPNDPVYFARLKQEIDLLFKNGTVDLGSYMCMAEEAVRVHTEKGILTGAGRGSAAGLLLAFALGITHLDPIEWGLSLERFLTLDRIQSGAYPDVDLDFQDAREVILGWLQKRFGDHQAQISTDMTLKARAAAKDVCRMTHGHVPPDAEDLTRRFDMPPQGVPDRDHIFGYTTPEGKEVLGSITYDVALQEFQHRYVKEFEIFKKCLGLARGKGRHASAFVIMNRPVDDLIPLMTVGDHRVTQFTAAAVEAMGGIKMDFLTVNALKDIGLAIMFVQQRSPTPIPQNGLTIPGRGLVPVHQLVPWGGQLYDVWKLPEVDAVFQDLVQGHTETVFQLNTDAATGWLKYFDGTRPDGRQAISKVYDLAVFTALDRPGPLNAPVADPENAGLKHNMLVEYSRRALGRKGSPDILPVMERLLPKTYGIMVFQEQLQAMYQELTGCTGAEAEEFRRNVSKKKMKKVEKAWDFFFPRAAKTLGEDDARKAWQTFITFGEYGFNLSHSACYAMTGYVCAFLKHFYPLEWWCAVLCNAKKDEIVEKFWEHCGDKVDLPDMSRLTDNFSIHEDRIVAPVSMLHGIGETAHAQLVQYAPYADLKDLLEKVEAHKKATGKVVTRVRKDKKTGEEKAVQVFQNGRSAINRRILYTLAIAGALDKMLPLELREGILLEKLAYIETVIAEVTGAKKVKPVPAWYGSVGALARYVLKKRILPVYAEDIRPIVYDLGRPDLDRITNQSTTNYRWDGKALIHGRDLKYLEKLRPVPEGGIRVAAVGVVMDTRAFTFNDKKTGKPQTATELVLDIDGETCKMVVWPRRDGSKFEVDCKHCVVLVDVSRKLDDKPFSLRRLEVIQRPVKEEEDEKDE
jgi:DNA polymerase III alpha subunit